MRGDLRLRAVFPHLEPFGEQPPGLPEVRLVGVRPRLGVGEVEAVVVDAVFGALLRQPLVRPSLSSITAPKIKLKAPPIAAKIAANSRQSISCVK